jgi:hypothetical protein
MLQAFFLLFFLSSSFLSASQSELTFSKSAVWQRLLQYENSFFYKKSAVNSPNFFISKSGSHSAQDELTSTIKALKDPRILVGFEKKPAACAFPARKHFIEKHLSIKFPEADCPDLNRWLSSLNSDRMSVVFAGAYASNPASLFGHTILRFYNKDSDSELNGNYLKSYALGFSARTNPSDSAGLYMLKGLFGGYDGYFDFEKFYTKMSVYNNSESRDLFEQKLNLSSEQVQLVLLILWEQYVNGHMPYYFASKNCAYRLLSILDILDETKNLSDQARLFTHPYEVVRILENNHLLERKIIYYPSLKSQLQMQLRSLSQEQKKNFRSIVKNKSELLQTNDFKVLDAAIDHWTLENYSADLKLNSKKQELMSLTYAQRAKVETVSDAKSHVEIFDPSKNSEDDKIPPSRGHLPTWAEVNYDLYNLYQLFVFSYGAHGKFSNPYGFRNSSSIEYLGLDLTTKTNKLENWKLTIVDIFSQEPFEFYYPQLSWSVSAYTGKNLWISPLSTQYFYLDGGLGVSFFQSQNFKISMMTKLSYLNEIKNTSGLSPFFAGPSLTLDYWSKMHRINVSLDHLYNGNQFFIKSNLTYLYYINVDGYFSLSNQYEYSNLYQANYSNWIGLGYHF